MESDRQPLDDLTFGDVMVAAQAGDQRAAERLFVELYPRVLRFLRASEPRMADDLAGEVWLAVARGLRSFEGDLAGFRAWVFTIARRRLADHRRTAMKRATDPVDEDFFRDRSVTRRHRRRGARPALGPRRARPDRPFPACRPGGGADIADRRRPRRGPGRDRDGAYFELGACQPASCVAAPRHGPGGATRRRSFGGSCNSRAGSDDLTA